MTERGRVVLPDREPEAVAPRLVVDNRAKATAAKDDWEKAISSSQRDFELFAMECAAKFLNYLAKPGHTFRLVKKAKGRGWQKLSTSFDPYDRTISVEEPLMILAGRVHTAGARRFTKLGLSDNCVRSTNSKLGMSILVEREPKPGAASSWTVTFSVRVG